MNRLLCDEEWGDWQADAQLFVLRYHPMGYPGFLYEIDLKRITSSAALLDTLFSVHAKWWATDAALNDLERAFQNLFNWCAVPSETNTIIYWEKRLGIASSCAGDLEWMYGW